MARNLPKDYVLYVKENPRQFDLYPQVNKSYLRNKNFYNSINKIPNTFLIDTFFDSKELILKSQAVATITGTIGIEAIKLNKPTIYFGDTWFSLHKNSIKVNDDSSCKDAYDIIKNIEKNDLAENNKNFIEDVKGHLFFSGVDVKTNDKFDFYVDSLSTNIINQINND